MSQEIDLKQLERKAWRSVFQDGLWDIYLGLLLLAMAVLMLLSDSGLSESQSMLIYIGFLAVSMLAMWAGKRFITVPRMGRVKFGPKGKARKRKARVVLAISVLVGVVVFFIALLAIKGNWSEGLSLQFIIPAIWSVNMLVVFGLGAYFLDFDRLYLIGLMYALALPVLILTDELLGIDLGFIAFAVPAALILLIGSVVFVRFLRAYAVLAEEGPPAERALNANQ